jgi:DnaK suppressor protein
MDLDRATQLVARERQRIENLLLISADNPRHDNACAWTFCAGRADGSEPSAHLAMGLAIDRRLRDRLDALGRADQRILDGTYGKSVRSGAPIPDERLEIDPAAEVTVAEVATHRQRPS